MAIAYYSTCSYCIKATFSQHQSITSVSEILSCMAWRLKTQYIWINP
ncbi:MAG: hypothetical protein ACI96W_002077, partial [Paraglaciecola sp.]